MAEAVRAAFAASENLMVEAGTGVGKSMAYLVPAALTARKNNIAVGIATKTNALLDQLVYHELPALAPRLRRRVSPAETLRAIMLMPLAKALKGSPMPRSRDSPITRACGRSTA